MSRKPSPPSSRWMLEKILSALFQRPISKTTVRSAKEEIEEFWKLFDDLARASGSYPRRQEPQPVAPLPRNWDRRVAALYISAQSGIAAADILRDPELAKRAYKMAAQKLHPDAGGTVEEFQELEQARRILTPR